MIYKLSLNLFQIYIKVFKVNEQYNEPYILYSLNKIFLTGTIKFQSKDKRLDEK